VSEHAHGDDTAIPHLETLIQSLSTKIEQIQSRGDRTAVHHFEDRIVKFLERLDTTDSRLTHLDAIERGLADLLVHIEKIRAQKDTVDAQANSTSGIDGLTWHVPTTHLR
jgi:hypothetical protein